MIAAETKSPRQNVAVVQTSRLKEETKAERNIDSGRFTLGTQWTGGWVGPRAGLDAVV
jgi:hypothetical protein